MQKCYENIMFMPMGAVIMDTEEMTYVEGGSTHTYTRTASQAKNGYTLDCWSCRGQAAIYAGSAAALGVAIGGPLGAAVGASYGLVTASMLWGYASVYSNAAYKAGTIADKYGNNQKVTCKETITSTLDLYISVTKK